MFAIIIGLVVVGLCGLTVISSPSVILRVLAGLVLVNLVSSTIYYNYIDPTMTALEARFVKGDWGDTSCVSAYRDNSGMQGGECGGGILDERDKFTASKRVVAFGDWRTDGWLLSPRTMRVYFSYGL